MNLYILLMSLSTYIALILVKFTNLSGTSVCLSFNHTKTTITIILVKLIIHLSGASMFENLPVHVSLFPSFKWRD